MISTEARASILISAIMLISLMAGCVSSNDDAPEISNNAPMIEGGNMGDIFLSEASLILLSVSDEDIDTLVVEVAINDLSVDAFLKNSESNGWSIVINIANLEVGNHKLKVIATDNNNQQSTWMSIISIIADPMEEIEDNQTNDEDVNNETNDEDVNNETNDEDVNNETNDEIVTGELEWWSEILLCDDNQSPMVDDYNTSQSDNHQCDLSFSIDSGNITISTNGFPNHDFESGPGCCASEQSISYTIPVNPSNDTDCTPSVSTEGCTMAPERGSVAFSVNGVPIYGPEDGPGGDAVAGQEGAYEEDRQHVWLGICHGHSGPGGEYHYHADGNCVHWHPEANQTWSDYSLDSSRNLSTHSEIVAFAFDGYPIYGFVGWDEEGNVKEMTSSYKLKEGANGYNGIDDYEYIPGLGDLDSCNGQFGVTPEYPNGTYHYHTTWENGEGGIGFPYFINCYRGEILSNDGGGEGEDPCAGHGETWGPGIGPPPEGCNGGPNQMSTESGLGMWIYSKIPPIGGITAVLILCVVLISRFKSTASYVSVLSLADTTDVCHQDLVLA